MVRRVIAVGMVVLASCVAGVGSTATPGSARVGDAGSDGRRSVLVYDGDWASMSWITNVNSFGATTPDGRYTLMGTNDHNLFPNSIDFRDDSSVILYDAWTNTAQLLIPQAANPGGLSADGRWVLVTARVSLDPAHPLADTSDQAFLIDRTTGAIQLASRSVVIGNGVVGGVSAAKLDRSGRYVFYIAGSAGVVPPIDGQPVMQQQLYRFDRVTETTALVSGRSTVAPDGWTDDQYSISDDGRYAAFSSGSTNIATGLAVGTAGLFVRDMATPDPTPVRDTGGTIVPGDHPSLSGDGSSLAFDAPLAAFGNRQNVFEWTRSSGALTLVSFAAGNTSIDSGGLAVSTSISGDGSRIAYTSTATNLVAGISDDNLVGFPGDDGTDVFVWDRNSGTSSLASQAHGEAASGNGMSNAPIMSHDGSTVAFATTATNLTDGADSAPAKFRNTVVRHLATQSSVYALMDPSSQSNTGADPVALSDDGSLVTFTNQPGSGIFEGETVPGALLAPTRFVPISPFRLADTRTGQGQWFQQNHPVGFSPGETRSFQVTGIGSVPAQGVSAVVLNVTTLGALKSGYLSVFPPGRLNTAQAGSCNTPVSHACTGLLFGEAPTTSNINVDSSSQVIANHVTVPVGAGGEVFVTSTAGGDVIIDVAGYYTPSDATKDGRFVGQSPQRILDTRTGLGSGHVAAGGTATLTVAGRGGVPATGASAVVLSLTSVGAPGGGYVTAYPSGIARPLASNLNLDRPGQVRANMVTVPIGGDGNVKLFNQAGGDLIADVQGYYTDGTAPSSTSGRFVPTAPRRFLDTRLPSLGGPAAVPPGGTVTADPVGKGVVPAQASAVVTNLTATASIGPGWVTAYPAGTTRPNSSNLNVSYAGQTIAAQATIKLGTGGVSLYTYGGGHLIEDLFGWFTS